MTSTIRDLTELLAVASNDYLLISDTSDVTNRDKRISVVNVIGGALTGGGTLATGGFTLTLTGSGTLALGGFTLTVPATGIAALKSGTPTAGRVTSWADANSVQDGGFALSDVARLSVGNTFAGFTVLAGGARSGTFSIGDQSFVQFTPPLTYGMVLVFCDNNAQAMGIASYRKSSYISMLVAGTNLAFVAGTLNGTTGTAGKATVSLNGTDLYIENRLGSTRSFDYLLL